MANCQHYTPSGQCTIQLAGDGSLRCSICEEVMVESSKLSAAEAKIAELKGELDNVFRHLQIVSEQSDERRRSAEDAESRLDAARRYCEDVIARDDPKDAWRRGAAAAAANTLNELNGSVIHPERCAG